MNVLDRIIAPVFPGWAFRRELARHQLGVLSGIPARGHGSGADINDQKARADALQNVGTPREDVERDRATDLQVARHLVARNGWARGAVNSIVGNVIGKGMRPESGIQIRNGPNQGLPADRENMAVEAAFRAWAKHADLSGKRSFRSIQRQVYRERWIANDVFVRRHRFSREERPTMGTQVPLALEVIGAELLADVSDGARLVHGIEFDDKLRTPIRYHFYRSYETTDIEKVDAADVIHIFKPHRPGAVRGIAPMAPVSAAFEALRRYLNHELTRAGVAAAFVALHKAGGGGIKGLQTSNATSNQDQWGNKLLQILDGGAMLLKGGPNDSLETAAPSIQSTAFDPFVRLILRMIATALGVSYELVARDFTKTNFSSARQANLEDRRQWEPEQEEFVDEFLDPVWEWFIDAATTARVTPFGNRRAEWPVSWTPQGWLWVDPQKEIAATAQAIELGIDNPIDAARRVGRDWHENIKKTAAAIQFAQEMGITLTLSQSTIAQEPEESEVEEEETDAAGAPGAPAASQAA